MKRRREITIETERLMVITERHRSSLTTVWCPACGADSQMVNVDRAAILSHATSRAIYGRVEDGTLHWTETPQGLLLICHNSLVARDLPPYRGE